ncbi:MAG: hypothetical protein FWG84_00035 [Bacteroidales bacterium]|nr:hypothetical protein [Bacteroidales bacterium]
MAATIEKERRMATHKIVSLSDRILTDFIVYRNKKSLKDLKGKISFSDDYDYKLMRN